MTEARPCPLCGAPVERRDRAWQKDGFDIVRCPSCTLLYRFDLPSREELAEIYAGSYFDASAGDTHGQGYQDYLGDETLHRLNACRRLSRLDGLRPAKGALLDVGAAAGFFVDEARRDGWDARGIDVSETMTAYARDRLHVDVASATLEEAAPASASLGAVTMWDYIEHASDPFGDLARAAEGLREGGVLGISTGDADSLIARASGARWHLLTPRHHNFFFTRRTLSNALDRTGFDVLAIGHPGAAYPLSYLVYKLQTLAGLRGLDRAASRLRGTRLGDLALPLNLYDIVTIWARRR